MMSQFLSALINSFCGRSSATRMSIASSARILALVVVVSHLALTSHGTNVVDVGAGGESEFFIRENIPLGDLPNFAFDFTASDVVSRCNDAIARYQEECNIIASTPLEECTYKQVMIPFSLAEARFVKETKLYSMLWRIHPDETIRNASREVGDLIENARIEPFMRKDLCDVVTSVSERLPSEPKALNDEELRYLTRILYEFKNNRVDLSSDMQEELKMKRRNLFELQNQYTTAYTYKNKFPFTKEQLLEAGVPESALSNLKQDDSGKYILSSLSANEKVRELFYITYYRQCQANREVFAEIVRLRQEYAALQGYNSFSDSVMWKMMAKNPATAQTFLRNLQDRLMPQYKEELNMRRQLLADATNTPLAEVHLKPWDFSYTDKLMQPASSDMSEATEYFPLYDVIKQTLTAYGEMLGLRFHMIFNPHPRNLVWHEDVVLFEVWDEENYDQGAAEFIGHLYLDLIAREGKYSPSIIYDVQMGCEIPASDSHPPRRQYPAAMVIRSIKRTADGDLPLLTPDEVSRLFRAVGFAMHILCSKVQISRFHGTECEDEMVEVPEKMFEMWFWKRGLLKQFSKHYLSGETLPQDLYERIVEARQLKTTSSDLKFLVDCRCDLDLHQSNQNNQIFSADQIDAHYRQLYEEILGIPFPEGISVMPMNPTLVTGYESKFYVSLYCSAIAEDLMSRLDELPEEMEGLWWRQLRQCILKPGGSQDAVYMIQTFITSEHELHNA